MPVLSIPQDQVSIFDARFKEVYPECKVSFPYDSTTGTVVISDEWWPQASGVFKSGFAANAAELKSYAAQKRYKREIEGIAVSGFKISTNRHSQMRIVALHAMTQVDPNFTVQWKTSDGSFVPMDAKTIKDVMVAMMQHVVGLTEIEGKVVASIDNGTITTYGQIDKEIA